MQPYAAYLRMYEPLDAFAEPSRSEWRAYVASPGRPRKINGLDIEHARAVRALIAVPPIVAPERESRDAYVRQAAGRTYVCPWQTRLRSWLAFNSFLSELPERVAEAFVPRAVAEQTEADFQRWKQRGRRMSPYIQSSTWHVPLSWFTPFEQAERCLVLGSRHDPGQGGRATATPTRTLLYVTQMAHARRRVARALSVIRRYLGPVSARGVAESADDSDWMEQYVAVLGEIESVGRWLEDFHPHSLVELDYGGLVHLLDDERLRSDESVAEVVAGLRGLEHGESELAVAMYKRLTARWRHVRALEAAN